MSPAERVLRSLLDDIEDGFRVDVRSLYAEDAEVTQPFGPNGVQVLAGAAEIEKQFASAAQRGWRVAVKDLAVIQSTDPHVVVAEFTYEWTLGGGHRFETANVQIVEERDGRIQRTRDYHDVASIRRGVAAASSGSPDAS